MTHKICVVTGSRADYGLLKLVMHEIQNDPCFTLQIIATGAHLSPTYGFTIGEIEADGFKVDRKVECLSASDEPTAVAHATGRALSGCSEAFDELKSDLVLVLGDRFEIFAASTAALLRRIPIAHIHGGEATFGAYDEAFRHSITKMSNIHFVATEKYRRRVIQLGESPDSVHIVGGLGVDAIKNIKLLSKDEVEQSLGIKFCSKSLLVTFHPETLGSQSPSSQIQELLEALSNWDDTTLIFTMPNADSGGLEIRSHILDFVDRRKDAFVFSSLGQLLYLSCMKIVDGVIGNSSSGILEAPTLKVGSVNIGDRQRGRVQAESVINSEALKEDLNEALSKLFSIEFKTKVKHCLNPYGEGGASGRIVEVLKRTTVYKSEQKLFYDLL